MLCAGVENTILSGCHGDSGGPYVCLNSDKKTYTLHGAVSWGSGTCNAGQIFTVFARLTQFRSWIKQHTGLGGGVGGLGLANFFFRFNYRRELSWLFVHSDDLLQKTLHRKVRKF